jgi:hypothetical protein
MKRKKSILKNLAALALLGLTFSGCHKGGGDNGVTVVNNGNGGGSGGGSGSGGGTGGGSGSGGGTPTTPKTFLHLVVGSSITLGPNTDTTIISKYSNGIDFATNFGPVASWKRNW